jgi:hypothetical protein
MADDSTVIVTIDCHAKISVALIGDRVLLGGILIVS